MRLKPSQAMKFAFALLALCTFGPLAAQEQAAEVLSNGGLESADESGTPSGWRFVRRPEQDQSVSLATDRMEGDYSALLRAPGKNEFTNLMRGNLRLRSTGGGSGSELL